MICIPKTNTSRFFRLTDRSQVKIQFLQTEQDFEKKLGSNTMELSIQEISTIALVLFGLVLWHINYWRLFNAKSILYI